MNLFQYKLNAYQYKILSILITIVYAIPILLSKYDFQDDIYRTNAGYVDFWFVNARPCAVYFYRLLQQGYMSPDIYPLTYVVSFICFYFLIKYLVNKVVLNDDYLLKLSIFILILCNPFFLQCLSYKYDSITIVISLCLGTFFVIKKQYKNYFLDFITRSVILFTMFCFYQPVLSFVIGLIAIRMLVNCVDKSIFNSLKDLLFLFLNIVIVFVVYKIFIADPALGDFHRKASEIIPINIHIIPNVILNIKGYLFFIHLYLSKIYVACSLILCCSLMLLQCYKPNYKKILISFICIPLLIISFTSANIVLKSPLFHPREMVGFSLPFVFLILFVYKKGIVSKLIFLLPLSFLLSSMFFSYSLYNYKNILHERNNVIMNDLLLSMYHFGQHNIEKIAFINETPLILKGQSVILQANPLIGKFFNLETFNSTWYSQAIINEQYNIHKALVASDKFPEGKEVFFQCYIQSTLVDKVLYVKTGNFCQ